MPLLQGASLIQLCLLPLLGRASTWGSSANRTSMVENFFLVYPPRTFFPPRRTTGECRYCPPKSSDLLALSLSPSLDFLLRISTSSLPTHNKGLWAPILVLLLLLLLLRPQLPLQYMLRGRPRPRLLEETSRLDWRTRTSPPRPRWRASYAKSSSSVSTRIQKKIPPPLLSNEWDLVTTCHKNDRGGREGGREGAYYCGRYLLYP